MNNFILMQNHFAGSLENGMTSWITHPIRH